MTDDYHLNLKKYDIKYDVDAVQKIRELFRGNIYINN